MDLRQERLERPPIQQRRDLRQPVTPTLLRPTYGTINPTQPTDPLASHEILRRSTPSWNHGSSIRAKVSMLSLTKHESVGNFWNECGEPSVQIDKMSVCIPNPDPGSTGATSCRAILHNRLRATGKIGRAPCRERVCQYV